MSKKNPKKNKIRVDFRRNMQNPARKSAAHWTRQLKHGHESQESIEDVTQQETLMGKGQVSKKRTVDIQRAGSLLDPEQRSAETPAPPDLWRNGTILAIHGRYTKVDDGEKIRNCVLRQVLRSMVLDQHNPVAVGDLVSFTPIEPDEGVIEQIGPRHGMLYRRYQHKEHLMVTNIDQVLIVASVARPGLRIHLVDRYIIACLTGDLKPIVVFNKVDLPNDEPLEEYESFYTSLGYTVVQTSSITGQGIDQLREVLRDRKSTVAGVSGVGKSSLINAVQSGLTLMTRPVNKTTGRGVHTTTMVQLLKLDFGGYIVDTPGIRQFAMFKMNRADLDYYFVDFRPFLSKCRYPDCTHIQEPGCAIQAAVEEGIIVPWRYDSYVKLYTDQEEFLESWEK